MIYLASPYSHDDIKIKEARFRAVCYAASLLMLQGRQVFSPIAHSHPIAMAGGLPGDFAFWKKFDETMLGACREFMILMLDGWKTSTGVAGEVEIARELGLPITYADPFGLNVPRVIGGIHVYSD